MQLADDGDDDGDGAFTSPNHSSRRSSGSYRSGPRPNRNSAFREPLLVDDGEPEGDGDVSIWTPGKSRGAGQVSSTCFNCTLQ
jgi:hypothetical protein